MKIAVLFAVAFLASTSAALATNGFIRLNQTGYTTNERKTALLLADAPVSGSFTVVDQLSGSPIYTAPIPSPSLGRWNQRFTNVYSLDFSNVTAPGTYLVKISSNLIVDPVPVRIDSAANLYTQLLGNALFYYQAQRDGPDVVPSVLSRKPSHLADQHASVYLRPTYDANDFLIDPLRPNGGVIDAAGGWFDAGDYVKFVETTSYVEGVMLFALREYPMPAPFADNLRAEARFGLDWLFKMWDQSREVLYYQVGLTDGDKNGLIGSDHDLWRLPEIDDQLDANDPSQYYYYVKHRPVFQSGLPGSSISPNLAGRLAAAFALGAQVFRNQDPAYADRCLAAAQTIFSLAQTTRVKKLLTTSPHDNYPETEWKDDLEWAAAELYFATASAGSQGSTLVPTVQQYYLQQAGSWARKDIASPSHLSDSLNLYNVDALAHYELVRALRQAGQSSAGGISESDLIKDLKAQLTNAATQSARDPFGLAVPYAGGIDIVPHALGYVVTSNLYRRLTNASDYEFFSQTQRDWIFGRNAWGTTFVIGAGQVFPFWPQHQVANLVGSHDGSPPLLLGGVVDGPAALSDLAGLGPLDGMILKPPGPNPFAPFVSPTAVGYEDNVIDWPTVEPANDYTVLTLLVFADALNR